MAARNPTAYTKWQSVRKYETGRSVLASSVDEVIADQIFMLDEERMVSENIITNGFQSTSSGTFTAVESFHVKTKDMCDVDTVSGGVISHEGAILAWADSGTAGEVRFVAGSTSGALAVTATSAIWHGWGTFDITTNDTVDAVSIEAKVTSGGGAIFILGWAIFALET
jgi:hypothetical protein